MTSYNKVNGVWSHYNYDLATTVLRGEWGYAGCVITDWWMRKARSPEFPKLRDNAYRALSVKERLTGQNQREPTIDEIAREMDMRREDVVFALDSITDPISLYDPVFQDGGDALCVMDQVRDLSSTDENWLDQICMQQTMRELSPREKRILALRFYDGKTQMEVAREIGISQAQVSRLEKGVLDKIKGIL